MSEGSVPITFNCACGKTLKVPDEHAGRRAKCPVCGAVVGVPGPDPVFEVVERPRPGAARHSNSPPHRPARPASDDDSDDQGTYRIARG